MRILAGQFKGTQITHPKGIRPTAGKVRAALFNIIGDAIAGARVADLCAGSGAVGLEAYSRGAAWVTWMESHAAHARIIRENVQRLERAAGTSLPHVVLQSDIRSAPLRRRSQEPFDLVFLDPPYRDIPLLKKALQRIYRADILAFSSWLVIEHSRSVDVSQHVSESHVVSVYRYGDTHLTVLKPQR